MPIVQQYRARNPLGGVDVREQWLVDLLRGTLGILEQIECIMASQTYLKATGSVKIKR
jgi:hypothetical protein